MKPVVKTLAVVFLLLAAGSSAWGDRVVTIYFAGTGLTEEWFDPEQTRWGHHEELLATLYREQVAQSGHHKLFVDGIGTGCGNDFLDLLGSGLPVTDLCRGWNTVLGEAHTFLNDVIAAHPGESITLNLLGFSRGGVAVILFATDVQDYGAIEKINVISFDPAAGDILLEVFQPGRFCLGDKVNEYYGFYASDERSALFAPAIPDASSNDVKGHLFRVPGAHETMMGNIQKDGHSVGIETAADSNLHNSYWVSKVIAVELLRSQDWGQVEFSWDWTPEVDEDDTAKSHFLGRVAKMYAYTSEYQTLMRNRSFILDIGFESMGNFLGVPICELSILSNNHVFRPRCASEFRCGRAYRLIPLPSRMDPLLGDDIWGILFSPPTAEAGEDQEVYADDHCRGEVTLDGSGSFDPDGDDLTYLWTWNGGGGEAFGPTPTIDLPLGVHEITLVVSDGQVDSAPDTVTITVTDVSSPIFESVSAVPGTLWPSNHAMVPVRLAVVVHDNCDLSPDVVLASVASNEPDDAPGGGDGNTTNDIQDANIGTLDYDILLRAERQGGGNGRIYTVTYEATDDSGNRSTDATQVSVGHNPIGGETNRPKARRRR